MKVEVRRIDSLHLIWFVVIVRLLVFRMYRSKTFISGLSSFLNLTVHYLVMLCETSAWPENSHSHNFKSLIQRTKKKEIVLDNNIWKLFLEVSKHIAFI